MDVDAKADKLDEPEIAKYHIFDEPEPVAVLKVTPRSTASSATPALPRRPQVIVPNVVKIPRTLYQDALNSYSIEALEELEQALALFDSI